MPDDYGIVGAYMCRYELIEALHAADLERFTNLECTYIDFVVPLIDIVEEGRAGGAKRFIAREKFREKVDRDSWYIPNDQMYQDVEDGDAWTLTEAEQIHWEIFHTGQSPDWEPSMATARDYLAKLLSDSTVDLVIYVEHPIGYLYVLKSPFEAPGRYFHQACLGIHPFDDVVVYGEDHPDHHQEDAPCLLPEILLKAAEIAEEEEKIRALQQQKLRDAVG